MFELPVNEEEDWKNAYWFQWEDNFYLNFGLYQIWFNPKLCDVNCRWSDPPLVNADVLAWFKSNPEVTNRFKQALEVIFPSKQLLEQFAETFEIRLKHDSPSRK